MKTADLQFNIIFVPFTIDGLSPLLGSLLEWSDCRYRIVSNGCTDDEVFRLKAICATNERLEFLQGPGPDMMDHGRILTWLQQRTESPWFCFMDSDILADGPFLDEIAACMGDYAVCSSGHAVWNLPEDLIMPKTYRRLIGDYFYRHDGIALSSTYFAVYNNQVLTETIKEFGVDFRACYWEHVPEKLHTMLRETGFEMLEFDTGKLLMALMYATGHRFCVKELEHLHHLGGFTPGNEAEPARFFRSRADRLAIKMFGGRFARPLLNFADGLNALRFASPGMDRTHSDELTFAERKSVESRYRRRRNTGRYFTAMCRAAANNEPTPPVPTLGNKVLEGRITDLTSMMLSVYKKHTRQMLGASILPD